MPDRKTLILVCILLSAVLLRVFFLEDRPMHTDEAVHAIKFGQLLEHGHYEYDPFEYHGPTLNYLTLIPAWLSGVSTLQETSETTLRIVPAVFGVLIVFLLVLWHRNTEYSAWQYAGIFSALSPAMCFYSRYYIMEMLFVAFTVWTLFFGWKLIKQPSIISALMTGLGLGLMHATKETCVLVYFSMAAGLAVVWIISREIRKSILKSARYWPYIFGAGLMISLLFFSSFFTCPRGILDSILTFSTYFSRAGAPSGHEHPWYYYFQVFRFEIPLFLLAVWAIFYHIQKGCCCKQNSLIFMFLLVFTCTQTLMYSVIPYKTPWSALGFWTGWILLAGFGAHALVHKYRRPGMVIFFSVCLFLMFFNYQLNYQKNADPSNPYVYGHTGRDIYSMTLQIEKIASAHPDSTSIRMDVICTDNDYWPLPWYLRKFTRIGWWNHIDPSHPNAPIVIVSPDLERELRFKLYATPPPGERFLYVPLFERPMFLRPGVELKGYIQQSAVEMLTYE